MAAPLARMARHYLAAALCQQPTSNRMHLMESGIAKAARAILLAHPLIGFRNLDSDAALTKFQVRKPLSNEVIHHTTREFPPRGEASLISINV